MNRTVALLLCLVAAAMGFAIYSKSPSQPALSQSASTPAALAPKVGGSKIYFVPIGAFPDEQLQPLVRYYHDKYNLEITVLNSIPVDPATRDQSRQQLMAENVVASLRTAVPEHANESGAILIGFTSEDIYPASKNWQFAFGWRQDGAAVVSTARLGLSNPFGVPGLSSVRRAPAQDRDERYRHPLLRLAAKPESEERSLQPDHGN